MPFVGRKILRMPGLLFVNFLVVGLLFLLMS